MNAFFGFFVFGIVGATITYILTNNLHRYSKEYDEWLNALMNEKREIKRNTHTVRFEGTTTEIWIANYPYSYGTPYPEESVFPSMRTRKRLANYLAMR